MSADAQLALTLDAPADEFSVSEDGRPYFHWSRPWPAMPTVEQSITIEVHPSYDTAAAAKAKRATSWIVDVAIDPRTDWLRIVGRYATLEAAVAKARALLQFAREWFAEHEKDDPHCGCCGGQLRDGLRVTCSPCARLGHAVQTCLVRARIEREVAAHERRRLEYLASNAVSA